MTPFQKVRDSISKMPGKNFAKNIRFNRLSLEIIKTCTNRCGHCATFGSPDDKRRMEKRQVFDLVREAKSLGFEYMHLWGGETFLHPDIQDIISFIFQNNFTLSISTNGFWAKTPKLTADLINSILERKPYDRMFHLATSCDAFHQSFPQTPIGNIANIMNHAIELCDPSFPVFVNSINLAADKPYHGLFPMLKGVRVNRDQINDMDEGFPVNIIEYGTQPVLSVVNGPLNPTVGRAKYLPPDIRGSSPLTIEEITCGKMPIFNNGTLYISVDGTSHFSEHHVGDNIFPAGNVFKSSIRDIISSAKDDNMTLFLFTRPFKYFVSLFSDHINVLNLTENSHSQNELFNRLYLAEG